MAEMFRCPSCKEIVRLGSGTCRFCSVPIDANFARAAAEELHRATQACAMANNIKTGNYGIPLMLAAALLVALVPSYWRFGPRILLVSLLGPGAAIAWFYRYGGLKTDDPEYPEAKRATLISLVLWSGAVLIEAGVVVWTVIRTI